jgi:signal transduction histidine kinase
MDLSSLRLRSKLYLSFGAVLMVGTLVAALMLVLLIQSSSSYKRVLETDRRVAEHALIIRADKLRISESLRGRLLHPYGDFGEQEVENIRKAYDELNVSYEQTRQLTTDAQLLSTLNGIEEIDRERLSLLEGRILQAIEAQESAEAERLYFDEYTPVRAEQQELLDRLNEMASTRITNSVEKTRSRDKFVGGIAVGLTLMLLVVGCLLSYYLTRSFERPISTLMSAARKIAAGDLSQKLTLNRKDELGDMAEVLNLMVMNLGKLNEDLSKQVQWLRETKNELAQTQGHLVKQEKMAALGQLVAGVAHELNNPISFVYSNTILLRESYSQLHRLLDFYHQAEGLPEAVSREAREIKEQIDYDYLVDDIPQALDDCHEGSRRVRDIVLNLRTFSRQDDSEAQLADITEGIEGTIKILGNLFRPDRVILHKDYAELPKIECYAGQLSQVWMNLLANAAQAMNNQGDIWLTTGIRGDRVFVQVRDAGPGMPEEIASKIFDPFFTTKPVGEGTGLGLSIVHGIIERHGGTIQVESQVGVGTTFTVELLMKGAGVPGKVVAEEAAPVGAIA